MSVILGFALLCLAAAQWAPDTTFGKAARRVLIDLPAQGLASATARELVIRALVLVVLVTFLAVTPEIVAIFGMSDVIFYLTIYFDTAIFLLLTSALVAYRAQLSPLSAKLREWAVASLARVVGRRKRSAKRARRLKPPSASGDEESEPSWVFALAA